MKCPIFVFKALPLGIVIATGLSVFVASSASAQAPASNSTIAVTAPASDPYLKQVYIGLNDSPMQQRLRLIAPFPVSVVYYQQADHTFADVQKQFREIKQLGFPALKQIMLKGPLNTDANTEKVFKMALDEGISPWYYGMGGWDAITPTLTKSLGIKIAVTKDNMAAIEADPKMVAYQTSMLKKRIDNMKNLPPLPSGVMMGEPGRGNPFITEKLVPQFSIWLEAQYKTVENLKTAWKVGYTNTDKFESFNQAAQLLKGTGIDDYGRGTGAIGWDTKRYRDSMRFQADLAVGDYKRVMQHYINFEPNEPKRTGGHQLFENQALNGWDLEGQAKAAAIGGSFYASIHLAHHFFLTDGEINKPAYMQARIVADAFKGGWAATWESTGGPTNYSGTHSYTVDRNLVRRLMLQYLAAGLKGIGFWTYNSRDMGWEAGEYALSNLQGEPSERAFEAAAIAKAIDQHRFELWDAQDEPTVGILYSWDNEAILGRLSLGGYPLATRANPVDRDASFAQLYSQSRIGLSRALMNQNVPFEYVNESDLKAGLAGRYKIIYLPYMLSLSKPMVSLLAEYVKQGGRIVADMPLLMTDENGDLNKYKKGETFEKLFGFQVKDFYNTYNAPQQFKAGAEAIDADGQFADIGITTGKVDNTFDNGKPAQISHTYGKGSTTVFNFEASHMCFKPSNTALEAYITAQTLGQIKPAFSATTNGGLTNTFRRANTKADHYFITNESTNTETVTITANQAGVNYTAVLDCLDGTKISADKPSLNGNSITVTVAPKSGKWLRLTRK